MKINTYTMNELKKGMSATIAKKLTLSQIQNFAELTGDFHPLHNDVRFAKSNGYSDIIAHGLLISSFSSSLVGMQLPGKNALVLGQSFKYFNPAFPGDKLIITGKINEIDLRFSLVTVGVKIRNQENQLISKGNYSIKVNC